MRWIHCKAPGSIHATEKHGSYLASFLLSARRPRDRRLPADIHLNQRRSRATSGRGTAHRLPDRGDGSSAAWARAVLGAAAGNDAENPPLRSVEGDRSPSGRAGGYLDRRPGRLCRAGLPPASWRPCPPAAPRATAPMPGPICCPPTASNWFCGTARPMVCPGRRVPSVLLPPGPVGGRGPPGRLPQAVRPRTRRSRHLGAVRAHRRVFPSESRRTLRNELAASAARRCGTRSAVLHRRRRLRSSGRRPPTRTATPSSRTMCSPSTTT